MTEAGEQWVEGHVKSELVNQDGAVPPSLEMTLFEVRRSQAEFWLRAFRDEVEKRVAASRSATLCEVHGGSCLAREGAAFDQLKRELLG